MNHYKFYIIARILVLFSSYALVAQQPILDLYYSGHYNKVVEHTSEAIASGDTTFNLFYQKAPSEAQMGVPGDAILTLQHARQLYPEDLRITRMLAGQYFDAGDYVKAWNGYTSLDQQ